MANETVKFTITLDGNAYSGVVQLDNAVQGVVKSVKQATSWFDRFGNTAFMFESMVGAVEKISSGFDALVGNSLQFEQAQANMRTLMNGNTEAADELLGKLREYGKSTVYDTMGLVEAQKTMMAFGLDATFAYEQLQHIGDIAFGDSQKMQSLALAFSQTTSTGKLMGQDLLQMINAGFNPLEVISTKTGKSIAVLKDEMSKGAISADMIAQAFQWATEEGGRFYQGAGNAAQSVGGRIAKMRDTIDEMKVSLFEMTGGATAYISEIGKMIAQFAPLSPLVVKLFDWMRITGIKAFTELKIGGHTLQVRLRAISIAAIQSGGALKLMGAMGKAACRTISVAIMNIPIIGWIAAAVAAVIGLFTLLWQKCEGFRIVVFTIWEAIKAVFSGVWKLVTDLWNTIYTGLIQPLWNAIVSVGEWIRTNLWEPIKNLFQGIANWVSNLFDNLFNSIWEKVMGILETIAEYIPGLDGIIERGKAAGKASWKKDHPTDTTTDLIETVNAPLSTMKSVGGSTSSGSTGNATTAVATGGTRNTEIHINIGDMIKQVVFNGTTRENQQEIERVFAESLNRVLGMAQVSV